MREKRIRISIAIALAAAAMSAGCAAREYRVARVNSLPYVLPPGTRIDRQRPTRDQRVDLGGLAATGGPRCRAEGVAFAVDGGARTLTIRLGRVFVAGYNQERMRDAVEEFRLALDRLESSGCLRPGGSARVLVTVTERTAMPALETSYVRYGFNRWRNYLDLRPGMSLGLQYAFARDGQKWGKDLANMDMGVRQYTVEARPDAPGVTLVRQGQTVSHGGPPREWLPDLERGAMPHYRLFFLTQHLTIKGQPERSATLLGARTVGEIQEATPKFFENADLTCRGKLTRTEPECISVDKTISFVPEIPVTGNGKPEYVTIGTTLDGLLRTKNALGRPFSLERRFGAGWRAVLFPANDAGALQISLLDGDRVTFDSAAPRPAPVRAAGAPMERKLSF